MHKLLLEVRKELFLFVVLLAALISMLFVPPSAAYVNYINYQVIVLLFCLMAVVKGFARINLFSVLCAKLLAKPQGAKNIALLLISLTYFLAMAVTNDVALLVIVPLTLVIFQKTAGRALIWLVVCQTVAANLGSMLTPVGNPQNLYLFTYYQMSLYDFLGVVWPVAAVGYLLSVAPVFFWRNAFNLPIFTTQEQITSYRRLLIYFLLFALCLLAVVNILDYRLCLLPVLLVFALLDSVVLKTVDYRLLATFVCFFIFVGNISSILVINNFLSSILAGRELLMGVACSQLISNVPAAIMLSGFTQAAKPLLLGVNIGGLGTLVASLASLISFRIYSHNYQAQSGEYLMVFTGYNLIVLILLLGFVKLLEFV
ncbi:MAG: SLC13 family permease [Clostridia bacterium]|nr:SLC13 family permease [Clostridia bacterium]MDD4798765.1 SLC13 family permease [Clostridia bacterium]